jgi:RNA recognition motif-containing protein
MSKNIYVGNLALRATAADLVEAFARFGTVTGARVVNNPETGLCRGFGFVEMGDGGEAAIAALNGSQFHGLTLSVSEPRPRGRHPRSGGNDRWAGPGNRW